MCYYNHDRMIELLTLCACVWVSKCIHFLERFISEKISHNRFIWLGLPSHSWSVFHFSFRGNDDETVVIFSQLDNLNRLGLNKNTSHKQAHSKYLLPIQWIGRVYVWVWVYVCVCLAFSFSFLFFSGPSFLRIIFIIVNENISVMCTHTALVLCARWIKWNLNTKALANGNASPALHKYACVSMDGWVERWMYFISCTLSWHTRKKMLNNEYTLYFSHWATCEMKSLESFGFTVRVSANPKFPNLVQFHWVAFPFVSNTLYREH